MILLINNLLNNNVLGILIWIEEFRPGNKTIYLVFDEESELFSPGHNSFIQAKVVYEKRIL